jgi:hypothetical protein
LAGIRNPRQLNDGGSELYDLERDPDELENKIDDPSYAPALGQLTAQIADWERKYPHRS